MLQHYVHCFCILHTDPVTPVLRGMRDNKREMKAATDRSSNSGNSSTSALFIEGHRKCMFHFYFLSKRENEWQMVNITYE